MTAVRLDWSPSAQGRALFAAATASLVLAVAFRRPELLAFATPSVWVLLTAGRTCEPVHVQVDIGAPARRAEEGVAFPVAVAVDAGARVGHLHVKVLLPEGVAGPAEVSLAAGRRLDETLTLVASRWGRYALGPLQVEVLDGPGLRTGRAEVVPDVAVLVLPVPRPWPRSSAPRVLPDRVGEHVTRSPGGGVEPLDVRPFASGDSARRVNWRVSSRSAVLHVTVPAADRAVDLVLIVDALCEVGTPPDTSLDRTVRTVAGMATRWLGDGDRVGLAVLGGQLVWLTPATGKKQLERVAEAILRAEPADREARPDVTLVPRVALQPGAVTVLISPLLDERALAALATVRERTRRVLVLDVLGGAAPQIPADDKIGLLAVRLWRLERAALIRRLQRSGTDVLPADAEGLDVLVDAALRLARGPSPALR